MKYVRDRWKVDDSEGMGKRIEALDKLGVFNVSWAELSGIFQSHGYTGNFPILTVKELTESSMQSV